MMEAEEPDRLDLCASVGHHQSRHNHSHHNSFWNLDTKCDVVHRPLDWGAEAELMICSLRPLLRITLCTLEIGI
jgi:hypothetical protein